MKLSTKGRYATRILLCIHRLEGELPVSKKRIAEQEGISPDYIEQIVVPLKHAGLVVSTRGLRGGFQLARDAAEISLLDILTASEGAVSLVGCLSEGCSRAETCVVQEVWHGASEVLRAYFAGITLQQLQERYERRIAGQSLMFDI